MAKVKVSKKTQVPKTPKIVASVEEEPAKVNKKNAVKRKAEVEPVADLSHKHVVKVAKIIAANAYSANSSDSSSDDDDEKLEASDDEEVEEEAAAATSESEQEAAAEDSASDEDDDDITKDVKAAKNTTKNGVSIFIGNLPSNIKRERILKLVAPHAKAGAVRFRRNDGGQLFNVKTATLQSIIAFVDVPTEAAALAVCEALNGTEVGGHVLRVNLQRNAKTAETMDEKRTICVGNLSYQVTDELLRETFECCGEIEYVRSLQNAKGCSGLGFVCFADAASVQMAFELNGGQLLNRPVRVERYHARKKPAIGKPQKRHQTFGAQRRLAAKGVAGDAGAVAGATKGGKHAQPEQANKKKNKSGFAGAKVSDKNKKSTDKKKKGGLKGPKLLAKKIAPRAIVATV